MILLGKKYTAADIVELMKIANMGDMVSLDAPMKQEDDLGDSTLNEFIIDDSPSPHELAEQKETSDILKRAIEECLRPREQCVMLALYGLDDGERKTLDEVGKRYNVTRERVRQIKAKALRKLRHYFSTHEIERSDF